MDAGYDTGTIVEVTVHVDGAGRPLLVDDEGIGFDVQAALLPLVGKKIRLTIVSFETMENLERMLASSQPS